MTVESERRFFIFARVACQESFGHETRQVELVRAYGAATNPAIIVCSSAAPPNSVPSVRPLAVTIWSRGADGLTNIRLQLPEIRLAIVAASRPDDSHYLDVC